MGELFTSIGRYDKVPDLATKFTSFDDQKGSKGYKLIVTMLLQEALGLV